MKKKITIITLFFVSIICIRTFFFRIYIVEGNSMAPSLQDGSIILVSLFAYPFRIPGLKTEFQLFSKWQPKRLSIVLFEDPKQEMLIKRLVGLPGDEYEFKNDKVYIQSKALSEGYLEEGVRTVPPSDSASILPAHPFRVIFREGQIPKDYFLVLGDNRSNTTDSRKIGLIPKIKLRGELLFLLIK
ncbi:MAG: signal peptidase I [Leptospiraceae bacterium]|nr:signal peptidase I [Leptospiraceae bacterium]